MFLVFVVFGVIGGIIGGMGMGGGTLLIPLLTVFAGVEQHVAQAVNLITFIPMSVLALFIHGKKGLIKKDGVFIIITAGLFFSVLGSIFAKNISGDVLKRIFGIFLIILASSRFFKVFKRR